MWRKARWKQSEESKSRTAATRAEGVGTAVGRMETADRRHSRKAHEGVTHTNLCFGKCKVQKPVVQDLG